MNPFLKHNMASRYLLFSRCSFIMAVSKATLPVIIKALESLPIKKSSKKTTFSLIITSWDDEIAILCSANEKEDQKYTDLDISDRAVRGSIRLLFIQ